MKLSKCSCGSDKISATQCVLGYKFECEKCGKTLVISDEFLREMYLKIIHLADELRNEYAAQVWNAQQR